MAKGFIRMILSHVVKHTTIRMILPLVVQNDLELEQLDVRTAFFHGDLKEQIYISQPEGFVKKREENKVCLLKRSLYGLKQSPRQWNKRFNSFTIKIGFNRCQENCLLEENRSWEHCLSSLICG